MKLLSLSCWRRIDYAAARRVRTGVYAAGGGCTNSNKRDTLSVSACHLLRVHPARVLEEDLQYPCAQVSKLRAEVAQFADIRNTLSFSADLLRDVTSQHIYSSYVAEHPDGGIGSGKYQIRGRSAAGAADGG